jgi:hypothetical protein
MVGIAVVGAIIYAIARPTSAVSQHVGAGAAAPVQRSGVHDNAEHKTV